MADKDQEYLDELQRQRAEEERLARKKETEIPPAVAPVEAGVTAASRAADYNQIGMSPYSPPGTSKDNPLEANPINEEERATAFWQANPNGAVKDPQTGILIGLGSASAPQQAPQGVMDEYARFGSGQGAPGVQLQPQQPQQLQATQQMTVHDFIDPSIQSRRSELQNERAIINRNLQSFSKVAPGRGQKSPWALELDKLKVIDHADGVLQNEQHQQSKLNADLATKNFALQRETQLQNDVNGFYRGLAQVKSPIYTPEHTKEVLDLLDRYPMASERKDVTDALQQHSQLQEKTVARQNAARAAGYVPNDARTKYARLQGDIALHQEASKTQAAATTKPNVPYAKAAEMGATATELQRLEEQYPGLKSATPVATPTATPAAVPTKESRVVGNTYDTPRGKLMWTGTGWVNP